MKKLLVVVDYQNDFVNGTLGFDGAEKLEERICEKISEYRKNGDDVCFTFDTHFENYLETMEGKKLPVVHCVKGTDGWNLYGKTAELKIEEDMCFEKNTFPSLELGKWLENKSYDTVELVGLVSNICVLSNAVIVKAALPEAEIIVDAKCTASADDTMNRKALNILSGLHVDIMNAF
ncbi:MAG: cysteine hydrolase [Ruminococcus sp.]|nr:cysteine hydrolase [Ruminococcus sp.]